MSLEFLNLSVDCLNAAIKVKDYETARDVLDKMENAGLKHDAYNIRSTRVLRGQLSSRAHKPHKSKVERNTKKRIDMLYRQPRLGQLMIHPDGSNPILKERLPSVDMLWARSSTAMKKLYQHKFGDHTQNQLVVHSDGGNPRMLERLPSIEMILSRPGLASEQLCIIHAEVRMIVHPNGGNERLLEKLPHVDMLLRRRSVILKKDNNEKQLKIIVHPNGGKPRMWERLPCVDMLRSL